MTYSNDTYAGDRWTYGGRFRPLGYGTIPRGFIADSQRPWHNDDPNARYGVIDYPYELTPGEVAGFELTLMASPAGVAQEVDAPSSPSATATIECILCQGSGERHLEDTCLDCSGKGEVQYISGEDRYGYPIWAWERCSRCDGNGWRTVSRQCGVCDGAGSVEISADALTERDTVVAL